MTLSDETMALLVAVWRHAYSLPGDERIEFLHHAGHGSVPEQVLPHCPPILRATDPPTVHKQCRSFLNPARCGCACATCAKHKAQFSHKRFRKSAHTRLAPRR